MRALTIAALLAASACAPVAQPAPPAPGPAMANYRAVGTEPGWTLTIANGRMEYVGDYGQTHIGASQPEPRTTFNGHRYETPNLVVDITHVQCNDGMSDRVYADSVMVTASGKTVRGCGGDILPPANLADTSWTITAINGEATAADAAYYLNFNGARLNGKAGCNALSGDYTVSDGMLTAGPIMSTKMACAPELMAQERQAVAVLSQPVQLRYRGAEILVLAGGGGSLTLRRSI